MKKVILSLVLIAALVQCGVGFAAGEDWTADQLAYDIYLDIKHVQDEDIRYLQEMRRIWDLTLDMDSYTDATESWFSTSFVQGNDGRGAERR